MAKSTALVLVFILPLLLSSNPGGTLKFANGVVVPHSWCVAKPTASDDELNASIEFACNKLSSCKIIQPGGCCYHPNTLANHASVVMNKYYATNGRNHWNCNFSGTGTIVQKDPSYGNCTFA